MAPPRHSHAFLRFYGGLQEAQLAAVGTFLPAVAAAVYLFKFRGPFLLEDEPAVHQYLDAGDVV